MSMVEDGRVELAMKDFFETLSRFETNPEPAQIKDQLDFRSYCLAHRMRASIEASWSIDLQSAESKGPIELVTDQAGKTRAIIRRTNDVCEAMEVQKEINRLRFQMNQ